MRIREIHEVRRFYEWSRDYWIELGHSPGGEVSHSLNFGWWPRQTSSLYEAQANLWQLVLDSLGDLNGCHRGFELGCGLGGNSVYLAGRNNLEIWGVDLDPVHVRSARHHAMDRGVEKSSTFVCANATQIPYESNAFDFGYCIESSFHYRDKARFLKEIHRLLRTDGIFSIADLTCEDNTQIRFRSGNHFPGKRELLDLVQDAGFKIIAYRDIGDQVYESLYRFVRFWNIGRKDNLSKFWNLVLLNYVDLWRRDLMGYVVLVVGK